MRRPFCVALAACVLARAQAYTPKKTTVALSDGSTAAGSLPPNASSAECVKCGFQTDGTPNCCSDGGSWHGTCGIDLEHSWEQGVSACLIVDDLAAGSEAAGDEEDPGEEAAWRHAHVPPPPAPAKPGRQATQIPHRIRNSTFEQQLRYKLLSNMDPHVPPTGGTAYLDDLGTRVSVQYRIIKVISLDVASSELSLKIWRRSVWYDPRLTWDPAEWGGTESFRVYPAKQGEQIDDNLWMPPLVTTNTIQMEPDTIETGGAWVKSDGRVWHSVPGTIDLSCRFTGLVNFPNDELSCTMELGSWTYADNVVNLTYFDSDLPWGWPDAHKPQSGRVWTNVGPNRPVDISRTRKEKGTVDPVELVNPAVESKLRNRYAEINSLPGVPGAAVRFTDAEWGGLMSEDLKRGSYIKVDNNYFKSDDPLPCAELGAQSQASGYSYQEYELSRVDCQKHTRTYPVNPREHWTSLWLVVYVTRKSSTYYDLTIIMPGILITLLSFGPLWLDVTKSGERISFGATMLLTILVLMTLVGEVVPRCGEMLLIHLINWVNFGYCVLAMLESFVVYYICFGESGDDTGHEVAGLHIRDDDAEGENQRSMKYREEQNARAFDYWNRRIMPTSYIFILVLIFTMDIEDDYVDSFASPTFMWFNGWVFLKFRYPWVLILMLAVSGALCILQFRPFKSAWLCLSSRLGGNRA